MQELSKLDGFFGLEGSQAMIKAQWNWRIEPERGDLGEVDNIIKTILNEVAEETSRKEVIAAQNEKTKLPE